MESGIHEVARGVHLVEGVHTNFVLVEENDEVLLIDSGWPKDRARLEWALAEIDCRPGDLRAHALTHAHADHLGNTAWLTKEHGVPVALHGDDARLARGEIKQGITIKDLWRAWRPRILRFAVDGMARGGLSPEHLTEFDTFADGDRLDVPGSPLAVHTPGHTYGHTAFLLEGAGVLITGDALVTLDLWDHRVDTPQVMQAPFHGDPAEAWRSLDRLESLDADVVVPGHGAVFHGSPAEAVAVARARS